MRAFVDATLATPRPEDSMASEVECVAFMDLENEARKANVRTLDGSLVDP